MKAVEKKQMIIVSAIALFPIGFYYGFRMYTAENIPIWDDFGAILVFLNRIYDTQFLSEKLKLLFDKYAEHRLLFVKTVSLLDYYLFGNVNFIRLNLIGNLGLLGILVIFFKAFKCPDNKWLWFLPVVFLLFQMQYLGIYSTAMSALQNIGIALIAILAFYYLNKDQIGGFALAIILTLIGTFSSGNGLFIFIVGVLFIFQKKPTYWLKGIWILVMITAVWLYFYQFRNVGSGLAEGFSNSSLTSAFTYIIKSPDQVISFFFGFIGSCFSDLSPKWGRLVSLIIGFWITVFGLYLIFTKYFIRNKVLFGFLLFLVASAFAATVMRQNDFMFAFSPRYHFYSLLFVITAYLISVEEFQLYHKPKYAYLAILLSVIFYASLWKGDVKHFRKVQTRLIRGIQTYHEAQNKNWMGQDINLVLKKMAKPESEKLKLATKPSNQLKAKAVIKEASLKGIYKVPYAKSAPQYRFKPLPLETPDLKHYFSITEDKQTITIANAWAAMGILDSISSDIYIILQSDYKRYLFETKPIKRPELIEVLESIHAENCGFEVKISKNELDRGNYRVGLLIVQNATLLGLKFSNAEVTIRHVENFQSIDKIIELMIFEFNQFHGVKPRITVEPVAL